MSLRNRTSYKCKIYNLSKDSKTYWQSLMKWLSHSFIDHEAWGLESNSLEFKDFLELSRGFQRVNSFLPTHSSN